MSASDNYVGCKIYIYYEDGKDLTNTTICEYRRDVMAISVRKIPNEEEISGFVNVLILTASGVDEYKGKLRRSATDPMNTEIALSNGKSREGRGAKRYTVNMGATVESMIVERCNVPLLNPLSVFVVNLSTTGALIRTPPNYFNTQCQPELKLNIGGAVVLLHCKIVWVKNYSNSTSEYGCKFV